MLKRISILLMLMAVCCLSQAQTAISKYRYWMDNGAPDSVATSSNTLTLSPDISTQQEGMHFFYFQAKNNKGKWGKLHKYMYYITKTDSTATGTKLTAGEYWIDDNYDNRKAIDVKQKEIESISLSIDISNLSAGVHFFRSRFQNDKGEWGATASKMFLYSPVKPTGAPLEYYEAWIDNDYEGTKKSGTMSGEAVSLDYDLSQMSEGCHFLYFRAKNAYEQWGKLHKYLFYIAPAAAKESTATLSNCEYWVDDDFANRTKGKAGSMQSFSIDISNLKQGLHYFSYRAQNSAGEWGQVVRKLFYVIDKYAVKGSPITAYRYTMNEQTVTRKISETANYTSELTLPLPKSMLGWASVDDNCKFTFDSIPAKATLKRNVECLFVMQFQNKGGNWSVPVDTTFMMPDSLTYDIAKLNMNGSLSYDKLQKGDFRAFEISFNKAGTYYLNASQECRLMIFNAATGERISNLELYELKDTYEGYFEAGKYYCILYNTITDDQNTSSKVNIRLMLTKTATVPDPVITYENGKITITDEMAEATIYYTTDGSDPLTSATRKLYGGAFAVDENCTIKAVATYDGYTASAIVSYEISGKTVARPMINYSGTTVTISCETANATIWYTTDGTDPTVSATRQQYTAPFQQAKNCVIKAIAVREGYTNSPIVELVINSYAIQRPYVSYTNKTLTIGCETAGATIYYEIGNIVNPATSPIYTGPITLTDNRTVTIIATMEGMDNSEMVMFTPNDFTCEPVTISYDGRTITMNTTTKGAAIRYTTDGTEPNEESEEYRDPITLDGLCTVKAVVMKAYTNSSSTITYDVPAYYNGGTTYVAKAGQLTKAYEWCDIKTVSSISIEGTINATDLATIKTLASLQHLNLAEAAIEEEDLPNEAFAGMNLISLATPVKIQTVGSNLLKGMKTIGAVEWNINMPVPEDILGGVNYPNMLLYVKQSNYADAAKFRNIVVGEHAEKITLSDAAECGNFYCPRPFTAGNITYSHNYGMETKIGVCQGWEAISLPFDVQAIVHETQGEIAPFLDNDGMKKPFWLYSLEGMFTSASGLKANTPYIICMPNTDDYAEEYILGGKVTFSAENTTVPHSAETVEGREGYFKFKPNFQYLAASDTVMTLNIYEEYEGNNPGSVFVANHREAKPFEAYVTSERKMSRGMMFAVADATTGIEDITAFRNKDIYSEDGVLYINANGDCEVKLYNTGGQLVRILKLHAGMNEIRDLSKGVYLVKGMKIIIR